MSLVEIKNLTKRFGDNLIWDNVNESIEKGDVIVIVGNSGCGKTTFLRCINMLETPSSGQIFIDGDEITAVGADIDKIRSKMGMVYQNFNLFSHLTVLENIIKAPMVVNKIPKEQAIKEGMEYLRMVGMQERADFMPDQLSGGQKQRVAIARTLYSGAKVLCFDDSLSAVDSLTDANIRKELHKRVEGITTIIISQRVNTLMEADKILVLDQGRIVQEGTHDQLANQPGIYREIVKIQSDIIEQTKQEAKG